MEHKKIIVDSGPFNERLYEKLEIVPINISSEYFNSLKGISSKLETEFKLLQYLSPPTVHKKISYIVGDLIPNCEIKRFGELEVIESKLALPIFATIPIDYKSVGINVYDCKRRINWANIPSNYRHYHGNDLICTHNPHKDKLGENCIIDILKMAWNIFLEYKRFDRTNKFELDCHSHR